MGFQGEGTWSWSPGWWGRQLHQGNIWDNVVSVMKEEGEALQEFGKGI